MAGLSGDCWSGLGAFVRTDRWCIASHKEGNGFSVFAGDTEYQAEFVIFAAPRFWRRTSSRGSAPLHDFEYSPWLTANSDAGSICLTSYGSDPTWDNVVMNSPTLGYVDAMHQSVRSHMERTVWTFYWALAEGAAASESKAASGERLELLEGSDPARSGASASRHSAMRLANRHHALRPCHGAA